MLAAATRRSGHVATSRLIDAVLIALAAIILVRHAIGFTIDTEYGRVRIALSALDWLWLAAIPLCVLATMVVHWANRQPIVATTDLIAANIALVTVLAVLYEAWLPQYSVQSPDTSLGQLWSMNHDELSTHPVLVVPIAAMIALMAVATYLLTAGLFATLPTRPGWHALRS